MEIFRKKFSLVYQLFPLFGIDTDPDQSDPGWHALDADADPDPAKCCVPQHWKNIC
jgi:hypothetical protein